MTEPQSGNPVAVLWNVLSKRSMPVPRQKKTAVRHGQLRRQSEQPSVDPEGRLSPDTIRLSLLWQSGESPVFAESAESFRPVCNSREVAVEKNERIGALGCQGQAGRQGRKRGPCRSLVLPVGESGFPDRRVWRCCFALGISDTEDQV